MAKSTWAKKFTDGLQALSTEDDYRLRRIVECPDATDEDGAIFDVAWNTLAHAYTHRALQHLEFLDGVVESPIERAMMFALCVAGHDSVSNIRYKIGRHVFGDHNDIPDLLVIEPQAQLGDYRVDFLLTYSEGVPDFENKRKLKDGTEIPRVRDVTVNLIVECDGHDFHDRTKDQASRDRERDRELKKLGFEVFRYTGADIWANPFKCATEALEVLTKRAWET